MYNSVVHIVKNLMGSFCHLCVSNVSSVINISKCVQWDLIDVNCPVKAYSKEFFLF